jgi:hypothetical protein
VASAVLVVALLPLFTLLGSSVRTTEVSLDELRAAYLADELMAQVRVMTMEPGFSHLVELPQGIDPAKDEWLPLDDPASPLYQRGATLPQPLRGSGTEVLDTQGWRLLGSALCRDLSPSPSPWIESLSRLYLSPLPEGYRRSLRLYRPALDAGGRTVPGVMRLEVKIEWDRTFLASPTQTRTLRLSTLLGNPGSLR